MPTPRRLRLNRIHRRPLTLAADELLIVRARLKTVRHLSGLLSPTDRRRRRRFRFAADRERYTAAHGLERLVLAALTDRRSGQLRMRRGSKGKPRLEPELLHFNLSHSGDWVVLAVSRRGPVGVDVETNDPRRAAAVLKRVAHPDDLPELVAQPRALWAVKEAIAKGVGLGLSLSVTRLRVEPAAHASYRCRHDGRTWAIRHDRLADGSDFAVAFLPGHRRIRLIDAL